MSMHEQERHVDRLPSNEVLDPRTIAVFTGGANPNLAHAIENGLTNFTQGVSLPITNPASRFPDGEVRVNLPDVRNKKVFIVQPTPSPAENLMELLLMVDAARNSSAQDITAVMPYFGYDRQDKPTPGKREPYSAALVVKMLEAAGAKRILEVDLHNQATVQTGGNMVWDHLHGSSVLIPELKRHGFADPNQFVIVSPDLGGIRRTENFAERMGNPDMAVVDKKKTADGNNQADKILGNFWGGQDVLIVDDMIDRGGTIVTAAELLKEQGANRIVVAATHGLFSPGSLRRISNSPIDHIFVTDTLSHKREVIVHPKISIVTIAPLLSEAIKRLNTGESIRDLNK